MKRRAQGVALVMVVLAAAGCASTGGGGGGGGGGSSSVLTHEELVESNEPDLYLAIERLRPRWLRPRGQGSFSSTAVVTLFVDGSPQGTVGQMRGMHVNSIEDVRYYSASEAGFRFGTIAGSGGTVAIRTRR